MTTEPTTLDTERCVADTRSPSASSPNARVRMQRQRTKDTEPELLLRRELWKKGLRYRVQFTPVEGLGRADIVFRRSKVAIFVDGCFWHSCPVHGTTPKSNAAWWEEKLTANRQRDKRVVVGLEAEGWLAIRVWEHEDPTEAAARIAAVVQERTA